MANILQVSPTSVHSDNRALNNQELSNLADSTRLNPSVPSRVNAADGLEGGKTGTAAGAEFCSVIDYESNYGAFIQKLADGWEHPKQLGQLLFKAADGFLFPAQEAMDDLAEQLLSLIQADTREDLAALFMSRQAFQAKFSGPFFDSLRNILLQHPSADLKDAVMAFVKSYNDYSSGRHLLQQMRSLTDDISHLMLKRYQADFGQLADMVNWNAKNGDTTANTGLLNGKLIPFLAGYISATHDYGALRDAVMLFVLYAVKYQNGDGENLQQLFEQLAANREFQFFFKGDARKEFEHVFEALAQQEKAGSFAEVFSAFLTKGAGGQAGLDNIRHFYSILNGMLLNESVYMPLLHLPLPFRFQGKDVMSELWVAPDAGQEQDSQGRSIKMLLRFEVQRLGKFELLLAFLNRKLDMQLFVPATLMGQMELIQEHVTGILKSNGLEINRLMVREKQGDLRLEEVFPEIREKEQTINVRI